MTDTREIARAAGDRRTIKRDLKAVDKALDQLNRART